MRHGLVTALLIGAALPVSSAAPADELAVRPGEPIAATIDGKPARVLVEAGRLDRLTLAAAYATANDLKPGGLLSRAELEVAGRREFKGRNAAVILEIAGQRRKGRAFWFADAATAPDSDGSIGPLGLPQARIAFVLGPSRPDETMTRAPLYGDIDSSSFTATTIAGRPIAISFEPGNAERYPIASAAAGALLAEHYGGGLTGPSWDTEILMGVRRPVRLLVLREPVRIGGFSIARLAVRVPDRIDASGRGALIAEVDEERDPAEVVVRGKAGKRQPVWNITLPRAALADCSRITFDKPAKVIELACRPVTAP